MLAHSILDLGRASYQSAHSQRKHNSNSNEHIEPSCMHGLQRSPVSGTSAMFQDAADQHESWNKFKYQVIFAARLLSCNTIILPRQPCTHTS